MKFVITIALVFIHLTVLPADAQDVVVGSKKFTENVILGEIVTQLAGESGLETQHRSELGGTRVLWGALLNGDIDIYPEYTGTLVQEIYAGTGVTADSLESVLAREGIGISHPLGFNNTYVLGTKESTATNLNLATISDLRQHPEIRIGFSEEFLARGDGWPALRAAYSLPHEPIGLDHDIAYRGLEQGSIDVIDLYSTDAEITYYNIVGLKDDREFFTRYDAVIVYRLDTAAKYPELIFQLRKLEDSLSEDAMVALNARAKIDRVPANLVAADFLKERGLSAGTPIVAVSRWDRLARNVADHLALVLVSLLAAILVALPLGVVAAMNEGAGRIILGVVGALYTIPALALLVFMIPLLGIGAIPAIVALFLYSLLPIVRNTHTGIHSIPSQLRESALAMGLTGKTRLFRIDPPLASRSILAGIKTAAVINIGTATLGALIGAGGLGQPILTGIR
ncbi:MAG: ABC transporter permease subunit, partial [Rhodothermales bacterium]|nr:ABC transporter permease subunit [Rhodothermales bacterium]